MAGYNRIIMMGNLTRDPEYKQLASGQSVCRLGLASNRQFKNRQTGDMIQEVCYIDIDVWGAQAESCNQYLQKGRPILVEGRIKFDTWEDPNGNTRSKHAIVADRVVFLSTPTESTVSTEPAVEQSNKSSAVEKDLMDQINQIKARAASESTSSDKKVAPAAGPEKQQPEVTPAQKIEDTPKNVEQKSSPEPRVSTGEIDFKDAPPFKDDLPF